MKKRMFFLSILLFGCGISFWYGQKSAEEKFQAEIAKEQDKYLESMHQEELIQTQENETPPEVPVVQQNDPQPSSGIDEAVSVKKELAKMGFDSTIEKSKEGRHLAKVKSKDPRFRKVIGQKKDNLVDEVEWNNYGVPEEVDEVDAEKAELSSGK